MGPYEIHTERQNAHWIAWITREGDPKPYRSVVIVAGTQEAAEKGAKAWAEHSAAS